MTHKTYEGIDMGNGTDKSMKVTGHTDEKGVMYIDKIEELNLLNKLISILENHCGERGDNEGAVETLKRIINERDEKLLKQKVRDTIIKFLEIVDKMVIHYPDMPECPHCNYNFNDKNNSDKKAQLFILRELKKELGL